MFISCKQDVLFFAVMGQQVDCTFKERVSAIIDTLTTASIFLVLLLKSFSAVLRVLYVRNLPFNISSEEMYDIFGKFGAVRQIRL